MFDGRFLANLLVTTFAQPVCEAEETTPYDEEMAELIARGGHPHSDYIPPLAREELNHTITARDQMLLLGFMFIVGTVMLCVDSCMKRKPLVASRIYPNNTAGNTCNDRNPDGQEVKSSVQKFV